jgi:hypothetical protein
VDVLQVITPAGGYPSIEQLRAEGVPHPTKPGVYSWGGKQWYSDALLNEHAQAVASG